MAKKTVGLLDTMEASLKKLLADMDKEANKEEYTLTDRMKVFDRVIKLEQLKQGLNPDDEGKGFED